MKESFEFRVMDCFFKQETAYELRMSDWRSDVCSSDLIMMFGRNMPQFGHDPESIERSMVNIKATGASKKAKLRPSCACLPVLFSRVSPSKVYMSQPTLRRRSRKGETQRVG